MENKQIPLRNLIEGLKYILNSFSYTNYSIISAIFKSYYPQFDEIIENTKLNGTSDIILSYGNNNYVLKVFLDEILQQKAKCNDISYTTITFNGYIHTTEDYVLKTLCNKLNIYSRSGFDSYQKELQAHFEKTTLDKDGRQHLIVIYYENFEHLMKKKKQILLYTLLELISHSSNIILIGFTNNYNLIDLMEKRIRSRFSQKTVFITVPTIEAVFFGIEKLIKCNPLAINTRRDAPKTALDKFHECLIGMETANFVLLINKYISLGCSIKEILTKIKYVLSMVHKDLNSYFMTTEKKVDETISNDKVISIINTALDEIIDKEEKGSYSILLRNFPKLHITLLLCLCHCTADYKEKITIGMIYKKYYEMIFMPNKGKVQKSKLDLTLVKKYLEELANSNLILIKNDDKYGCIYELKMPLSETVKVIRSLSSTNKLDDDMRHISETIKY